MDGSLSKRAPFTRDEPIRLERDAFGHADYVCALASIVTDEDAPSTVGVFGPWGVGKSTIVESLAAELPEDVAYVYFDAWKYEEDSLRRQFLKDVEGQLKASGDLKKDVDLSELDVETQTKSEGLGFSKERLWAALIPGVAFGVAVLLILQIGNAADFLTTDEFGQQLATAGAAALLVALLSHLSQVVLITETIATRRTLQDPDRFAERFAAVLAAARPRRIVIVVDNLDRCSPDKAVEMLSTIKTYLEPAVAESRTVAPGLQHAADKQVIFVIAVDDEALRRHLIAQESERSRWPVDRDEAHRYADEYLAKFFSARLPIREILPDDIREYVGEQLDQLVAARGFKPERQQLVSLVGEALRHNPRHVKQFINDLETRLRFLEHRETARNGEEPGISPPVSDDILAVAKLALLEAEFPKAFKALLADHRKLAGWHAEAARGTEVWVEPPKSPNADQQRQARKFGAFLRASRGIDTPHLRALLRLKQSRQEARVPGFQEFRAAVVANDRGEVEQLVEGTKPDVVRGYAEGIPKIVREELDADYLDAARAAVAMIVEVEGLRAFEQPRNQTLKVALDDPSLKTELSLIDPQALLRAGSKLPDSRRNELCEPVVASFIDDDRLDEERQAAAGALAEASDDLTSAQKTQITQALETDLSAKFGIYVGLIEAEPDLVPAGLAQGALEELGNAAGQGQASLSGRDEAFAVAKVALGQEQDPDMDHLAIEHLIASIDGTRGDSKAFEMTAKRALELVPSLRAADAPAWQRLADHLAGQWQNFPTEHRLPILRLLQSAVSRAPESERMNLATTTVGKVFADPDQGVELARKAEADLEGDFRNAVVVQLTAVAGKHAAQRFDAARLVSRLAPEQAPEHLREIAVVAMQQGHDEAVVRLLDEYAELLKGEMAMIADEAVRWARQRSDQGGTVPYPVLLRLVPRMTPEALTQLGALFVGATQRGDGAATEALHELAADPEKAPALETVLPAIVDALGSAAHLQPPVVQQLEAVRSFVGSMSDDDQERLGRQLNTWLATGDRVTAAAQIREMRGLRAGPADDVVAQLIEVSKQEPAERRLELLLAANAIRGGKNWNASKRLESHLGELEGGAEAEQAVAQQLRESIDG